MKTSLLKPSPEVFLCFEPYTHLEAVFLRQICRLLTSCAVIYRELGGFADEGS